LTELTNSKEDFLEIIGKALSSKEYIVTEDAIFKDHPENNHTNISSSVRSQKDVDVQCFESRFAVMQYSRDHQALMNSDHDNYHIVTDKCSEEQVRVQKINNSCARLTFITDTRKKCPQMQKYHF
jgi:hypothetical protein